MTEIMGTAAQEAVRIADAYLPRAPMKRRMALAKEIVEVVNLCERELAEAIIRGVKVGSDG